MTQQRRDFLRALGAAGLTGGAVRAVAAEASPATGEPPSPKHDMSAFPASWRGQEQIVMLLYPGFTALDLVGPQYMLANLMGAKVHLVARSLAPVRSDTGLSIVPTMTLARAPRSPDILFVPGGGEGTLNAMKDKALMLWIADRGRRAAMVASVCTGSILLGQAGLLHGRRATSHWATHALLSEFGATPVDERVVWDGPIVTGAGVSAGLDLGLSIVARLRDDTYAKSLQLLAEYAPMPPFDAGTPGRAPRNVSLMMSSMFDGLRGQMLVASRGALPAQP